MRNYFVYILIQGLIGSMTSLNFIEVTDYWPEVGDDLSKVTWSHATNSHDLLYQALQDDTMMIEADVNIGLNGEPIMAHPPVIISDLSLQQFLDIVIEETAKGARKGIKLDFKAIEIVQPSLEIVKQVESKLNFPVWFNADIIVGPGGGDPVDADRFLELCAQYFPGATLSPGFTTGLGLLGHYTTDIMNNMYNKLVEKETRSPVTIPIRASLGARSVTEIKDFMDRGDHDALFPVTLTIWSGALDLVDMDGLRELVLTVGKHRIYVDVPFDYESPEGDLTHKVKENEGKGKSVAGNLLNSFISLLTFMF